MNTLTFKSYLYLYTIREEISPREGIIITHIFRFMNSAYYVEDSISMQELVKHSLSESLKVTTFNNCADALAFIKSGNLPDIVITDLDTPIMNGYDFLLQLKSTDFLKAIPVIVLSGEESTDARIKSLEAGADDYIVKPFHPQELQARINNILKRTMR